MPNAGQQIYQVGQSQADPLAAANQKLNDYYGGGGTYYPGLFNDLGLNLSNIQEPGPPSAAQQPAPQQGVGDPFMAFLLNQLGIAGLNQQPPMTPENQMRMRFGREPLPNSQPAPSLYDTTIGQISNVDSLLAQLLGSFQGQPAPPVMNTGMGLF